MRSLFEKNVMRMKSELRDLKTVHNRGLGTVEFFRYRTSFTATKGSYYTVNGTIATGEPGTPLIIGLAKGTGDSADMIVRYVVSGASSVSARVECRKNTTATVDIICSSVLNGIAVQ